MAKQLILDDTTTRLFPFDTSTNLAKRLLENFYIHCPSILSNIKDNYSIREVDAFKAAWNNLPCDKYLGRNEKYRSRRIAKMRCYRGEEIIHLDDCSFFQSEDVNNRLGGIERIYSRSEDHFIHCRMLGAVVRADLGILNEAVGRKNWMVTCHQFRITSDIETAGFPTPEGIHRDGHDFVAQHLIARSGVSGGESRIYDDSHGLLYSTSLEDFLETLMLDDRRVKHDVSRVTPQLGVVGASYRDMLIVDFDELILPAHTHSSGADLIAKSPTVRSNVSMVAEFVHAQLDRHQKTVSLTANENVLSNLARSIGANRHYDRYFFDCRTHPGHRYAAEYNGMQVKTFPEALALESFAQDATKRALSAAFMDLRFLSGVHCTMSMVAALTRQNDVILSICPDSGGHFATAHIVRSLGRRHDLFRLTNNQDVTLDDIKKAAALYGDDLTAIVFDHGMTTHHIPIMPVRELLNVLGLFKTLILYDASHVLGLIAGKAYPNPLDEGADVLQGNTHKSLPGPHRAIALCRDEALAERISRGVSAGLISSIQLPSLLQLFVTMLEVDKHGAAYASKMISNAKLLAACLRDVPGLTPGPSDTHIVLLEGECVAEMAMRLNEIGIRVNDKRIGSRNYLRLGTQEITRLGIDAAGIESLGQIIRDVITGRRAPSIEKRLAKIAAELTRVSYSFDEDMVL